METPPADSADTELQEPLGSVLARLSARLLDAALMFIAVLAGASLSNAGRIALLVAVPILYETVMVATAGRTAGKMLLGLHVVRRSDGGTPGWLPALTRGTPSGILAAGPTVAAVLMVLSILPMVGDTRLQRSLQDRIAGTVVVQRQRPWGARSPAGSGRGAP
ncbi:MAG: RDD family protein [Acidimicrobiia bacterium]|nr:RDD family protein [Acidimicrobiia bacterium]